MHLWDTLNRGSDAQLCRLGKLCRDRSVLRGWFSFIALFRYYRVCRLKAFIKLHRFVKKLLRCKSIHQYLVLNSDCWWCRCYFWV